MKKLFLTILFALAASNALAQRIVTHAAVDQRVYVRIIDSTDGSAETGVVAATSGLDLEYIRNGSAAVDLTESDLAAVDSAHSDGGIKHVGGGRYRVDVPDAAFASGAVSVDVQGVCTGMIVIPVVVQLSAVDLQGTLATPTNITAGTITTATNLTNLPTIPANWLTAAGTAADFTTEIQAGLATPTNITAGTITTVTTLTNLPTVPANWLTAAGINANAFSAAKFDADVTTEIQVGLATAANLATVDDFLDTEMAATLAAVDTEIAAILADTNELQTDWANGGRLDVILDAAGSAGDPWVTAIPGAYGAGTAGFIIGTNLNATVSSRATPAQVNTEADTAIADAALATAANLSVLDGKVVTVDTVVDAIKVVTDKLGTALELDGAVYRFTANAVELVASSNLTQEQIDLIAEAIVDAGATLLTDVDQEPVPASRTWLLVTSTGEGMKGEAAKSIVIGPAATFAMDFRNDMAVNDRIVAVGTPVLVGEPSTGITFGTTGRDKSQAKVRITPGTAGTYTIRCTVTLNSGTQQTGTVILKVAP